MITLLTLATEQAARNAPHSNRIASWLARTALEEIIEALLRVQGLEPGRASSRARLSCLEVAYQDSPKLAGQAQYAWSRLSEACHHHAYQLSPTNLEVVHLLGIVQGLQDQIPNAEA